MHAAVDDETGNRLFLPPARAVEVQEIMMYYPNGLREMAPGFGIMTDRRAGVVTDDTQMAVCLHHALVRANEWDAAIARQEYLRRLAPALRQTSQPGIRLSAARLILMISLYPAPISLLLL